jgi:hypothetical protein
MAAHYQRVSKDGNVLATLSLQHAKALISLSCSLPSDFGHKSSKPMKTSRFSLPAVYRRGMALRAISSSIQRQWQRGYAAARGETNAG